MWRRRVTLGPSNREGNPASRRNEPAVELRALRARSGAWHGLLGSAEQVRTDHAAVTRERSRDPHLANPVEVADAPIELLQRIVGRLSVSLGLGSAATQAVARRLSGRTVAG
jgi:hypothetical protein